MSSCALWDRHLIFFERIIFETIIEHLEYGLVHDSKGLAWLCQIDIDFQYRSFEGLRTWCLRPWLQDGWPSFWLAHTLLPLLTSRPLLALWASHEHYNFFFLIALLTFYTRIGVLQYIYALFGSLMSHGLIDSSSSLFFVVLSSFLVVPLCLYPLFYHLSLLSRFFPCHEWWSFTFQCMEDGHVPFHSYLMDVGSEILNWEGHFFRESLYTTLFKNIFVSLCILSGAHLSNIQSMRKK